MKKKDFNMRQFFLCLYGESQWELEFAKAVKILEKAALK